MVLGAIGCGDSTAPVVCTAEQPVTVAVSSGLLPLISWSPACGMAALQLRGETADGLPTGWFLYSGPQSFKNPLRSGIRYGQAPEGIFEPNSPPLLRAGAPYSVTISRWVGDSGPSGTMVEAGVVTFSP
jgi:hypothetical protein